VAEGITIRRVFDAPRVRIWQEWTEPASFADWFGGTGGEVPLDSVSMDVRAGGRFRMTMFAGPERRRIDWHGEYLEVLPPERLVFTISDRVDDDRREVCTVVLAELDGGRTEMLFTQRGGGLTPEQYEQAGHGWSSFFDRVDERLGGAA
jgi:uncharacterized protein YndB with AHSA1/START domain